MIRPAPADSFPVGRFAVLETSVALHLCTVGELFLREPSACLFPKTVGIVKRRHNAGWALRDSEFTGLGFALTLCVATERQWEGKRWESLGKACEVGVMRQLQRISLWRGDGAVRRRQGS